MHSINPSHRLVPEGNHDYGLCDPQQQHPAGDAECGRKVVAKTENEIDETRWEKQTAEDHLNRMTRSLRELSIDEIDTKGLKAIDEELIQENHLTLGDAMVYIQVTRGAAPRKHVFPDQRIPNQ